MLLDGAKHETRDDGTGLMDLSARGAAFGNLATGTRPVGGVRLTWKDGMPML
ncbi:hypothetical protein [Poseidonocella sp. HB161398]|uniref:hypothetical protein n=1 Tax=Poseidonocella sp. HB161398 TaxID=2320855 RepID=UPI0014861017|nr:hypothetical protein [Poseidonocella sp. HB161398]